MKLKIIKSAYHRNGVAGAPFHVALFRECGKGGTRKVGIVFDQEAHCAVLDVDKLAAGDIAFGSNSWRGDDYEPLLRDTLKQIDGEDHVATKIDVDDLLALRRQVAFIWSIEDVQEVRPDLNDDQAWKVLQTCRDQHDCECGFTWMLLETTADEMFPETAEDEE